jgi:hypothetical protein
VDPTATKFTPWFSPTMATPYQRYILMFLLAGFIYFLILRTPDIEEEEEQEEEKQFPAFHETEPVHANKPEPYYERRIVGIGDLHGDLPNALKVLKMTGVLDENDHWSGNVDFLVQTGDIIGVFD